MNLKAEILAIEETISIVTNTISRTETTLAEMKAARGGLRARLEQLKQHQTIVVDQALDLVMGPDDLDQWEIDQATLSGDVLTFRVEDASVNAGVS